MRDEGSETSLSSSTDSAQSRSNRFRVDWSVADALRDIVAGVLVGMFAGIGSFVFLRSLSWATDQRLANRWLLWLLPLAGFVLGTVNQRLAGSATRGTDFVLDDIHEPAGDGPPLRMSPLALIGATVTHLFGGSGGREGAAVQIAAGFSAVLRKAFPSMSRRRLALAAASGGFGSVFGVPFAGAVFGLEFQVCWRVRLRHALTSVTASFVGDIVARALGLKHEHYAHVAMEQSVRAWLSVLLLALCSGLCALAFIEANHLLKGVMARYVTMPGVRLAAGGFMVIAGVALVGTRTYLGLSLPLIELALTGGAVATFAFAIKMAFTVTTLGSGFPGGEVTPLFCVGACLGASLADVVEVSALWFAPLGFVAVFAAASHTPIACSLIAIELFGWGIAIPAIVTCVLAAAVCGRRSIYAHQRVAAGPDRSIVTMAQLARLRNARLRRWVAAPGYGVSVPEE